MRGRPPRPPSPSSRARREPCDAAVIGPGLGSHEETDRLVERFVAATPLPTVVDAGALLAWGRAGRPHGTGPLVLTPHAQEMSRLTGMEAEEIEADREAVATRFAGEWASVLVLKGAKTLIAGSKLYVNTAGSPGLGTAGSGDVLAGVIGGLLARGAEPIAAAVWGVHLHALAGEGRGRAAGRGRDDGLGRRGVPAGDAASLRGGPGRVSVTSWPWNWVPGVFLASTRDWR